MLNLKKFQEAAEVRDELKSWLLDKAFPIWWEQGADHALGGFHEKIDQSGQAVNLLRRGRVQPRQIYSFAIAKEMGWTGPALQAVRHGLDFLLTYYPLPAGGYRTLVAPGGAPADDFISLYDQAFILFALASAHRVLGREAGLEARAVELRDWLRSSRAHPRAGFEETAPPTLPLKSNPHMHLFEASLAWVEAGGDGHWQTMADEIAELALTRFIDPRTGVLREYFDADWKPIPGDEGRLFEPGHQFEWAWLLLRWGQAKGRQDAMDAAFRLIAIGETHGIDPVRGVAFNSLFDDFTVHDFQARLWPQTERIKAGVLAASLTGNADYWRMASAGARGLMKYFSNAVPGIWWDRLNPDNSFVAEAAPATSLYHIVCAAHELDVWIEKAIRP